MSCTFNDLLLIEKANLYISLGNLPGNILTPEQKTAVENFSIILNEIPPITIEDETAAIETALIEIRDRDAD